MFLQSEILLRCGGLLFYPSFPPPITEDLRGKIEWCIAISLQAFSYELIAVFFSHFSCHNIKHYYTASVRRQGWERNDIMPFRMPKLIFLYRLILARTDLTRRHCQTMTTGLVGILHWMHRVATWLCAQLSKYISGREILFSYFIS